MFCKDTETGAEALYCQFKQEDLQHLKLKEFFSHIGIVEFSVTALDSLGKSAIRIPKLPPIQLFNNDYLVYAHGHLFTVEHLKFSQYFEITSGKSTLVNFLEAKIKELNTLNNDDTVKSIVPQDKLIAFNHCINKTILTLGEAHEMVKGIDNSENPV